MSALSDLARAYHFAAVRHLGQQRKGKAGEPYINHLTEVADLVAGATAGDDVELIMAAVLHDVLEDTQTSYEELVEAFGPRVAAMVAEVSDDKTLPRAERKRLQIVHAAQLSHGAKIIKLADKTANLRSLRKSPPADWDAARIADYRVWALAVAEGCHGANPALEDLLADAAAAIEPTSPSA